jgi:hypothetical protein
MCQEKPEPDEKEIKDNIAAVYESYREGINVFDDGNMFQNCPGKGPRDSFCPAQYPEQEQCPETENGRNNLVFSY